MQIKILFLGLALCLLILNTSVIDATSEVDNTLLYQKITTQTIKRGLSYDKIERLTQEGWIIIHVLKMTMHSESIDYFTDVEKLATQVVADNVITLDMLNIELEEQVPLESQDRQLRKGMGLTEDGEVLVAIIVDKSSWSIGATADELKELFLEYKVMKVDDFNQLGFISQAELEPARKLVIEEDRLKMFVNSAIEIKVKAVDKYSQPVMIAESELVWSVSGISGNFNGNTFTATTAGKGKITVYQGSIYQSVDIEVVDLLADLTIEEPILYLDVEEIGSFNFTGTDGTGFSGPLEPSAVTYSVSDTTIGNFVQGKFVSTDKKGITKIVARFGGRSISGYVVVGKERQTLESFRTNPIAISTFPAEDVTARMSTTTEVMKDDSESLRMSYHLDVSEEKQIVTLQLTDVTIDQPAEMLTLDLFGNRRGHQLKVNILDFEGETYSLVLKEQVDWIGWKSISVNLPENMVYPLTILSFDIVIMRSLVPIKTSLFFDSLSVESYLDASHIKLDVKPLIEDPLMSPAIPKDAYRISMFGPTKERNRLLDAIILNKTYKTVYDSELSVFAGDTHIDANRLIKDYLVWRDTFMTKETNDIKVITLGTGSGGLRSTDASQFQKLQETLATTSQNNIIIVANRSPNNLNDFDDEREAAVIHDILITYRQKSGKNIFYVNGNSSKMNVTIKDHIRYIDLNGLAYTVNKSSQNARSQLIDLNNSFYTLEFYVVNRQVTYRLNNLFPMVTY